MQLTPKQVEYLNNEIKQLHAQIKLKENHKIMKGRAVDCARMEALLLIMELHNLEAIK